MKNGVFGFLNLYKPKGVTSFQVLGKVKKFFNTSKVGHMGTLDPLAEGVLPVAINEATKLIQFVKTEPKSYRVKFLFGFETESYDLEKVEQSELALQEELAAKKSIIELSKISDYLESVKGEFMQVPPVFSSVKIGGVRAYELARKNAIAETDLKARKVSLFEYKVLEYEFPYLSLEISVSSGFYVRSLVRDLAKFCSTVAVMTELVRTKVGFFEMSKSVLPEQVCEGSLVKDFDYNELLVDFVRYDLMDDEYKKIMNGLFLDLVDQGALKLYAFYNNQLVSILEKDKLLENKFRVYRNI